MCYLVAFVFLWFGSKVISGHSFGPQEIIGCFGVSRVISFTRSAENGFSPENNFSPGNEEFSPHNKMAFHRNMASRQKWLLPKITSPKKMKNSWTDIELFCKFFPQKIKKMKNYFLSLSQGTAFSALYGTWIPVGANIKSFALNENGFSPKMASPQKITYPQEMKNSWT